jgi:ABC-type amino acid transport substrate-binding protein
MSSESSAHDDRATIPQSSCKDGAVVSGQTTHIHGARILLRNSHLHPHRLAHSPARARRALIAGVALACTLFAGSIDAAAEAQRSPQTAQRERLTIAPAEAMKPWTGDLDGMIERGSIRVLTIYSKTFYFVDKGTQHGALYDFVRLFEEDLNTRLAKEQKLKHEQLKVRVVFIPVARGDLLPALAAGKGDIAASNLTITAER